MGFIIGLLTVIMVLDCLVLIFLVLIQLPKKEAGAGLAFGGGATDALFGAGSGTVLTKITKYAATIFFVLAVMLSIMQNNYHNRSASAFQRQLAQPGKAPAMLPGAAPGATPASPPAPASTNMLQLKSTAALEATNAPAPAATSAAPVTAP